MTVSDSHRSMPANRIKGLFNAAVEAHKSGRLDVAERGYKELLEQIDDKAHIRYLLGALMLQLGRLEEAVAFLDQSNKERPAQFETLSALGAAFSRLNRHEDAAEALSSATQLKPGSASAWFNLGIALSNSERPTEALTAYETTLKHDPGHAAAKSNLGLTLRALGELDRAGEMLREHIAAHPDDLAMRIALAEIYLKKESGQEALNLLAPALPAHSNEAHLHFLTGMAQQLLGQTAEAKKYYEKAITLKPDDASYKTKIAGLLYGMNEWENAERYAQYAIRQDPDSAKAYIELGRNQQQLGRLDEATDAYRKAIELAPRNADAFNNLGNTLLYTDKFEDALKAFDTALEINPDFKGARFNKALALLRLEDFTQGWPLYDIRYVEEDLTVPKPNWPWPEWIGQDLNGKRILLWPEQGIGDLLLHGSILPLVAKQAEHCSLTIYERLAPLFRRSLPNIDVRVHHVPPDRALLSEHYDFHASVVDACRYLIANKKDLSGQPYLKADSERTEALRKKYKIMSGGKPVIGVSWKSGRKRVSNFKSTDLTDWQPILSNEKVSFLSLQYGPVDEDLTAAEHTMDTKILRDETIDPLKDLDGFASQVSAVDLVISVSNTTVHMAGALGVSVWNLVPTGPGSLWYWHVEGETSPWYDSMTLIRHSHNEDWTDVLETVGERLRKRYS